MGILSVLLVLLAQVARGGAWGFGFGELAIGIVIAVAVLGILWIFVKAMEIPIPQWFWHIAGIVLLALVAIVAIKLVLSM